MRQALTISLSVGLVAAAALAADPAERRVRVARLDLAAGLPASLSPDAPTWDFRTVRRVETWQRVVSERAGEVLIQEPAADMLFRDPTGGDSALRWLFPERYPELRVPGSRHDLVVEREAAGVAERLEIRLQAVGRGRLILGSTVRAAVLLRSALRSSRPGGDRVSLRWVAPAGGVLAEISGIPAADGASLGSVDRATIVESVQAAADLKIFIDQFDNPPFTELHYGFDGGSGVAVASLLANNENVVDMGDVVDLDYWDFSVNTSGIEVAQTTVTLNSDETCNVGRCGYFEGIPMGRQDRNFEAPNPDDRRVNNQINERVDGAAETTIWLRAGTVREGVEECFGDGESGFCYEGNDGNKDRTEVPLWVFKDVLGDRYFEAGDSWASGVFDCEQNVFNTICGANPPPLCLTPALMYAKACSDKSGTQFGDVLKGGVATLPSGHTLNTLLVRTTAEFCVYSEPACFIPLQQPRSVVHLWQVPYIGTVALMQSDIAAPADLRSFSTLDESNITFGHYPPESIAVQSAGADSVEISWDPGALTSRIDDFRVYWDIDSGAVSPYSFNSVDHAAQVVFDGNSATVSGLGSATTYFFTVTARSGFPSTCVGGANEGRRCVLDSECGVGSCSGVGAMYESLLFPKQVQGDPGFVYPIEVRATTAGGSCTPTTSVSGLTVGKVNGGCQICWDPVVDPCVDVYDVLGSDIAQAPGNFRALHQTDATCWTGAPSETFFLVNTRGTGGSGPPP